MALSPLDSPGRPIISDIGSELYNLSGYIDHFLQPLAIRQKSYIKDSFHFVEIISFSISHHTLFWSSWMSTECTPTLTMPMAWTVFAKFSTLTRILFDQIISYLTWSVSVYLIMIYFQWIILVTNQWHGYGESLCVQLCQSVHGS